MKYVAEFSVITLYNYCKYKHNYFSFRCGSLGVYSKIKLTQYREKKYIAFHVTGAQFIRASERIFIDEVS